jgi:uncharacterized protein YegP (UPF0339 family)
MGRIRVTRKQVGGPRSVGGDLYVSKQKCSTGIGFQLSFRFSAEVMDRMRWRSGDTFVPEYEREGDIAAWYITPCRSDEGVVMHCSSAKKAVGLIKATVEQAELDEMFPGEERGYKFTIDTIKGSAATFLCDYSQQ